MVFGLYGGKLGEMDANIKGGSLLSLLPIHQIRPQRILQTPQHIRPGMHQPLMLKNQHPPHLRVNVEIIPPILGMKSRRSALPPPLLRLIPHPIEIQMQRVQTPLIAPRNAETPIKMRSKVLSPPVLQKPHPLIQPRHPHRFLSPHRPPARDAGLVLDDVDFRDEVPDTGPDLLDNGVVVPDDTPTVSNISQQLLLVVADIDHGLFPGAVVMGFGGADELRALGRREGIVDYYGIGRGVFRAEGFGQVDNGLCGIALGG